MATSFTTNFNLGKPSNGDTNWGPVVNSNFDTVDTALQAAKNASNITLGTLSSSRLPLATSTALGAIKGFSNLTIGVDGSLSLTSGNVTAALGFTPVDSSKLGTADGVATLNASGVIPAAQLSISTTQITEGTKLFFTNQRAADAAPVQSVAGKTGVVTLSTSDLSEGSNLFYTTARFDTRFSAKTSDNLTEGTTNKYFTDARFDSSFSGKSTSNLSEGSNLYYTAGRVNNQIAAYSRAFKTISDATGVFSITASSYSDSLVISGATGLAVTFDSTNKKLTFENTGVTSVNGDTGAVVNIAETDANGKLLTTHLPSLVDPSKQSFAQLNAIGGLDAHATDGDTADFFMNTEGAKTVRKIMVSSPSTPASGTITFDLKVTSAQGGTAASLFPTTKPTLTCANGAAWRIIEGTTLGTVEIPNNAMVSVNIISAPAGAKDLRVELFEYIEVFHGSGSSSGLGTPDPDPDPGSGSGSGSGSGTTEPAIGDFVHGGYYAGKISQGGQQYYIIVAPKEEGETFTQYTTLSLSGLTYPTATRTLNNGPAASASLNSTSYPAARFCETLTLNGYSDWYLPSRDELELCYRNLRPTSSASWTNDTGSRAKAAISYPEGDDVLGDTNGINRNSVPQGAAYTTSVPAQTSIDSFKYLGTNAFGASSYATSSTYVYSDNSENPWVIQMSDGNQFTQNLSYDNYVYTRAVRRVAVG